MHDCAKEGLGFRITTTKNVTVSENGRVVPVRATVANKEFTRALVFNPLAATFAGIASILGLFMYAIDWSLCLSLVSAVLSNSISRSTRAYRSVYLHCLGDIGSFLLDCLFNQYRHHPASTFKSRRFCHDPRSAHQPPYRTDFMDSTWRSSESLPSHKWRSSVLTI